MYGKIICIAFFLALASAHVRREISASDANDVFFPAAKTSLDKSNTHIKQMVEGKDENEKVKTLFKDGTNSLWEKAVKIQHGLETDLPTIQDEAVKTLVQNALVKVTEIAQQLKETLDKEHPVIADYMKALQVTIKSLVDEAKTVADAAKGDDEYQQKLVKHAKETITLIVKGVSKLEEKIHAETQHSGH